MRQRPRFLDPLFSNALFIIVNRLFVLDSFTSVTSGNMQVVREKKDFTCRSNFRCFTASLEYAPLGAK